MYRLDHFEVIYHLQSIRSNQVAVLKVRALDREGILATRLSGSSRRVSLDPRYFAYKDLRSLLLRLAEAEPALGTAAARRRSRPRRAGKPI